MRRKRNPVSNRMESVGFVKAGEVLENSKSIEGLLYVDFFY